MKKLYIVLCLVVSAGLANAAIQNQANPDKPSRLYVETDTQGFNYNGNGISYDYYNGAHILVGTASGAQNYNHTWTDGAGGGGSWSSDHTDSTISDNPLYTGSDHYHVDGQFSWAPTDWPTLTNCTETLTGDTWLLGWADIDVGLDPWQSDQVPLIQMEHCQIKDTKSTWTGTNNYSHYDFKRTAQTKMKLQTGGKALSKQQNLFVVSGSATAILANFAIPPFANLPTQPISARSVVIGSLGSLGSDGNRYVALPDNASPDVTPSVAGQKFYTFNVSAQKCKLHILANGNPLSDDHVRRGAYFCVGQSLTFAPVWSPSVPNVVNTIAHWSLPGEFVNEYVPPPSPENGSGSYIEDAALLANETTSCWYYNKLHPGTASIGLNLQFSNGQTVSLARLGQFDIYRPTISGFQPSPPYYAALVPTNSPNELQLGDEGAHGLMQYNITVSSTAPFSGGFNIVQLVNASRSLANTTYGGGQQQTTSGQFWLDNSSPYFVNGDSGIFSPYYYNSLRFFDQPGYGLNYIFGAYPANLCSINDSFKDYVVFKPDGANSIYVTLGRVFWSWSASTSKSGGVWSNPTYQVNGPSAPDDSDEFPTWPATLYNSGVSTGN
jgi:hypothetical protein